MQRHTSGLRPEQRQDALGLAEGVGTQQQGQPLSGSRVAQPEDLRRDCGRSGPAVDRQAEGAFGDEGPAAQRLESGARRVRVQLVVPRHHPHLAATLDADLGATEHMARRVKRQPDAIDHDALAVLDGIDRSSRWQSGPRHGEAFLRHQVSSTARSQVVGVGMGDDRTRYRTPGIDAEVAPFAAQAPIPRGDQRRFCAHGVVLDKIALESGPGGYRLLVVQVKREG